MPSKNQHGWVGQYLRLPEGSASRAAEGGRRLNPDHEPEKTSGRKVSVVTVAYNAGETIERTIKSVLNQTYDNIEYIVIDGGSTDDTVSIIKQYENQIDYFASEPDNGVYNAMNKGISTATGDYVCLLNADDRFHEEFVEILVRRAKQEDPDIVCGVINKNEKIISPRSIDEGIFIGHLNIFHGTFLVKRECYDRVGPYNEEYRIVSDTLWVQDAFEAGASFAFEPGGLVYFSDGGLSSGSSENDRELIISEAARMLRRRFPFLSDVEARELYLLRFRKKSLFVAEKIVKTHSGQSATFDQAMRFYVEYCFALRESFLFNSEDIEEFLPVSRRLLAALNMDWRIVRFDLPRQNIPHIFDTIDLIVGHALDAKKEGKEVFLQFAEVFSRPSETFIYDLLSRMQASEHRHNIFLCDERVLEDKRPYDNTLTIPWSKLPHRLRLALYERFFSSIEIDFLICHFATNGRWLHGRLSELGINLPTVQMTHGIDVFAISTNEEYREFIENHAILDPATYFTTPSQYLKSELVARGVPEDKILVVHNVVHPRFFEHRKTTDFYDGSRELRLINIGRLIELKGHRELLTGLKYFVKNVSTNVSLTLVYGGEQEGLAALKKFIASLQLERFVKFKPFVNFEETPAFYAQYDLFIMSSKISDDKFQRAESFGIVTLEAIAAGLPVIATDAGASPEIVGRSGQFARVVPHSNGEAIGKAIEDFVSENSCFRDNLEYAQERLNAFSIELQEKYLNQAISKLSGQLRVAVFSAIASGGAGGAAMRVHEALLRNNVLSKFITRSNQPRERYLPYVVPLDPDIKGKWDALQNPTNQRNGYTIFTIDEPRILNETLLELTQDADIINLHWVARQLSVENIAFLTNLGKPVVLTIRDMQPLAGGCHFFHGCEKWQTACEKCPQIMDDNDQLPNKIHKYKVDNWNRENLTIVALSNNTANIVSKAPVFEGCDIEVIYNPIDLDTFQPIEKSAAREVLELTATSKIVFYIPSFNSLVKGQIEFIEALNILRRAHKDCDFKIVTAGSSNLKSKKNVPYDIIDLGRINDKEKLAWAYSAADVTVIPSLEETFSNTAAESVACGTPIAGFETGAIGDIAGNGARGFTAPVGDVKGLAEAIYSALKSPPASGICRDFALDNFKFSSQGQKYKKLFQRLSNQKKAFSSDSQKTIPPLLTTELGPALYKRAINATNLSSAQGGRVSGGQQNGFVLRSKIQSILADTAQAELPGAVFLESRTGRAGDIARILRGKSSIALSAWRFIYHAYDLLRHRPVSVGVYLLVGLLLLAGEFIFEPGTFRFWMRVIAGFYFGFGAAYLILSYVRSTTRILVHQHGKETVFRRKVFDLVKTEKQQ